MPLLKKSGATTQWRDALYYAYYMGGVGHNVPRHFGVRTETHKLMYFPKTDEWNMFDMENDPSEMHNLYDKPEHQATQKKLMQKYQELRKQYKAPAYQRD